jgi:gliding motility-associated-like protein
MSAIAQSVAPTATYTDDEHNVVDTESDFTAQAPLDVTFRANPSDMGSHTPAYEWHFRKDGVNEELLVRYEENTQYTFTESGTFRVTLKTRLTDDATELDSVTIKVTISESHLEMPNAFSPNGDGTNDRYGAKGANDPNSSGRYKSIVSFHAWIFNRWGQKLYEWTDVSGSWDGTYNGKPVKDGVYYVLVKAKGADGREYNIRRDVNLMRSFTERTSSTSTTGE